MKIRPRSRFLPTFAAGLVGIFFVALLGTGCGPEKVAVPTGAPSIAGTITSAGVTGDHTGSILVEASPVEASPDTEDRALTLTIGRVKARLLPLDAAHLTVRAVASKGASPSTTASGTRRRGRTC